MASRREKYPETTTFHYYNANPKNRITGDCSIRAVSTALEEDYTSVLREMVEYQIETGYAFDTSEGIDKYLQSKGWKKCRQPRKTNNRKYTGVEFCRMLSKNYDLQPRSNIVCTIGCHHFTMIKRIQNERRYKVFDIWDCTDGCIGNYWVKA